MDFWRVGTAFLLGATAVVCTSCSQQRICNGPAQQPPTLLIDGGAWAAAHPSAQLIACLAGTCTLPASGKALAQPAAEPIEVVLPDMGDPRAPVQLSLTATDAGRDMLKMKLKITLREIDEVGACGTVSQWRTSAELTPTGELRLE